MEAETTMRQECQVRQTCSFSIQRSDFSVLFSPFTLGRKLWAGSGAGAPAYRRGTIKIARHAHISMSMAKRDRVIGIALCRQ